MCIKTSVLNIRASCAFVNRFSKISASGSKRAESGVQSGAEQSKMVVFYGNGML